MRWRPNWGEVHPGILFIFLTPRRQNLNMAGTSLANIFVSGFLSQNTESVYTGKKNFTKPVMQVWDAKLFCQIKLKFYKKEPDIPCQNSVVREQTSRSMSTSSIFSDENQ